MKQVESIEDVDKAQLWYDVNACPSCGACHQGYHGKWDSKDRLYVVCERTNDKVYITEHNAKHFHLTSYTLCPYIPKVKSCKLLN